MGKVTPLKIDVNDGRLPLKDKVLDMKDFSSVAELRREISWKSLLQVSECLHILVLTKEWQVILLIEILSSLITSG